VQKYLFVKITKKKKVATWPFSKPPVNVLSQEAYLEIANAFNSLSQRDDVQVIIFCSEGKGFLGGNDVSEINTHTKKSHPQYQQIIADCMDSIASCRHPVIGAIQGYAIGAGMVVACACDMVVASEDAWFNVPELSLGVIAGASFLMSFLPEKVVRYLCFTGDRITADDMLSLGAINYVVSRDQLMTKAEAIAEKIASQPPTALTYFKEIMNIHYNHQFGQKFQLETAYTGRVLETPEKQECLNAFFEKRKPNFDK
jgi:enoyl-CoA hydratase